MVTLDLIALLANIGVMVAIARAPHLKRFAFVCHLCAVDVLCAVLLMPLGIISSSPFFGTVVFTILECQVYIFLNVFLICLSIFTVTAISIERYFYIVHPMRYEVNMTVNLVIVVMLLIWIKSLLLAMVTSFGWPAYGSHSSISAAHCSLHASHSSLRKVFAVLFSVTCFMVPSFVIFAVYCAVYKVARSAALQQAPVVTPCQAKDRSDSINSQTTMITTTRTIPKRLSPERAFSGGEGSANFGLHRGTVFNLLVAVFHFPPPDGAKWVHAKPRRSRGGGELVSLLVIRGEPVFLWTFEPSDQR
ncbi:hypothetical protein NQD34_003695 [Periophthalmus magnuspinnatus]|nr:hypothetical protein NQD34_003695 [Periophthalmus magnuspinnatus]